MIRSTSFAHILVTRVGIGIYDEAWFDYRLSLFEAITVPSMVSQSSQDFTWMLVVDEEMPAPARRRLDQVIAHVDNALVTPVEFKTDLVGTIVRTARERATEAGATYVVTSRLDDDDALRLDAFERLHSEVGDYLRVSSGRCAVFSFNLGCMWDPTKRFGFTRYHPSHSIGMSLVEPAEDCESVHAYRHLKIKNRAAARGAYIGSIEGGTRWWLYSTHYLADSEHGDRSRINKVLNHPHGYPVDDSLLTSFGLHHGQIQGLERTPEPETAQTTRSLWLRAEEIEGEIRQRRDELRNTATFKVLTRAALRRQLDDLERQRRRAGSGIIRRDGSNHT